jgi:hypothetical protein
VEEGKVGAIRYLAILPQYQGLSTCTPPLQPHDLIGALIGHRLLRKVEEAMITRFGCCRAMVSVPECRATMIQWLINRDYTDFSTVPYPALATGHTLTKETPLVMFQKPLEKYEPLPLHAPPKNGHLPPVFRMMKESRESASR